MLKIFNLGLLCKSTSLVNSFSRGMSSTNDSFPKSETLFKIQKVYEPKVHPNCMKNNPSKFLPPEYSTMMQVLLPSIAQNKKITKITIDKRRKKYSLDARLATPEGRIIMLRRIIKGRNPPTPFHE